MAGCDKIFVMHDTSRIISSVKKLSPFIKEFRKDKKSIVLTQGTFDLVHIGHARYCEAAKSFGDVLIVGVDSDEKVKKRKGKDRPIVPQEERLEMLTHLRSVDLVVVKELDAPKFELVKAVKPDVLVVTRENYDRYTPENIVELKKLCGSLEVLEPQATTSTSAKIRLLQMGAADRISATLSKKLIRTIEEVLAELKS